MKRLSVLIATLGMLALPATALAQGECPATMKSTGNATGSLSGSTVVMSVYASTAPANIETPHGVVHTEVTSSLVYTEPEPSNPQLAKRVWNHLAATEMFSGPMEGAWQVLVTVYYKVWGPGTRVDPYYVNYDGVEGQCVVSSATPYHNGVWPDQFGLQAPIR